MHGRAWDAKPVSVAALVAVRSTEEKGQLSYGSRVALMFIFLTVSVVLFFSGTQVVVAAATEAKHCSGAGACEAAQIDAGNATPFALAGFAFAVVAAGFATTMWRRRPDGVPAGIPGYGPPRPAQTPPLPPQPPAAQHR